jgi:hypothetical protein
MVCDEIYFYPSSLPYFHFHSFTQTLLPHNYTTALQVCECVCVCVCEGRKYFVLMYNLCSCAHVMGEREKVILFAQHKDSHDVSV